MNQIEHLKKLLHLDFPLIQGGMIWTSGASLAIACAKEGILGTIGAGSMPPEVLKIHLEKVARELPHAEIRNRVAVNLPLLYHGVAAQIQVALDFGVQIFITTAGNPKTYTPQLKALGKTVLHAVSNAEMAKKCEDAGVDAVIAEGFEAGGHNGRDELTTMVLIPQVVDAVKIPVIAAGGIYDARTLVASLCLGASGVQMGTRFLMSEESSTHIEMKKFCIQAQSRDTTIILKKQIPVRLLRNKFCREIEQMEEAGVSVEQQVHHLGKGRAKLGLFLGDLAEGELEIGQNIGSIKEIEPVAHIVATIKKETQLMMQNFASFTLSVIFAILLFSATGFADSYHLTQQACSPLNLTHELGPNRNQGKIYWCYAHATADLLAYHFKTPKLSAVDIALQYNNSLLGRLIAFFSFNNRIELQNGLASISLKNALKQGVCSWENMPDESILRRQVLTQEDGMMIKDSSWEKIDFLDGMEQILLQLRPTLKNQKNYHYEYSFPNFTFNDLKNLLRSDLANKNIFDIIVEQSCRDQRITFNSESTIHQSFRKRSFLQQIHQQLFLKNPVIIDYFEDVLFSWPKFKRRLADLHTSLIVGRRWNETTQSCELLVRESYGAQCDGYCIDGSCEPYAPHFQCEQGNLWIKDTELLKAIVHLTYFEI